MERVNQKQSSLRFLLALVFTVVLWGSHIYLRSFFQPGDPVRLILTTILVVCFAWMLIEAVFQVRRLDEFQRQIYALALAIAYPVALALMFAVGFFAAEGLMSGSDPRDLPSLLLLSFAIGFTISSFRYR